MHARRIVVALSCLGMLISATATTAVAASPGTSPTELRLTRGATTHIVGGHGSTFSGDGLAGEEGPDPEAIGDATVHGGAGPAPVPPTKAPKPKEQKVVDATGTTHFGGLNHYDQRVAGTGDFADTQFSLEPPDQGLCVGKGFVVETVNTAIRVRRASNGALLTEAEPLNQFFGLSPEIIRTDPLVFGDFTSDPKCYFDPAAGGHWFVTLLQLDVDPATGDLTGGSSELLAVSTGADPRGNFFIYSFDTTNDGTNGTPNHGNCPCFGDQPLLGADRNGIYITTNEFSLVSPDFNGANVYAISKSALTAGTANKVIAFAEPTLAEGQAYSIQPATTPAGAGYANENGGSEYFLSALEFTGGFDNRIALWAMTNTSSLSSAHPRLKLDVKVLASEVYGAPPVVQQKGGDTPLRDLLADPDLAPAVFGVDAEQFPVSPLNSNDDRMNQTVYVNGTIWGAVNTAIGKAHGGQVGIAWFAVQPSTGRNLDGAVVNQGYVAVNHNDVFFPSVAVNGRGKAIVAFTLAGRNYFPSAAYAELGRNGATGAVQVVSWGVGPADGFTGYLSLDPDDGGVERWGDYSAAAADEQGNLWFATETINQSCTLDEFLDDTSCGGTRTILANWGTIIAKVRG